MPTLERDNVLMAMQGRFADFYHQHAILKPNSGELRGPCPVHGGLAPNFTVDPETGHWYCHSGCQDGGDVFDFLMRKDGVTFPDAVAAVANFAGLSEPSPSPRPAPAKPSPERFLDPAEAARLHGLLMDSDKVRRWLSEHRSLTTETLKRFQIGLLPPSVRGEEWRITFPVFDRQGRLINIRRHLFAYKPELTDERRRELGKTLPWDKGLNTGLFPLSALDGATEALIVEGEADAALACQMGFAAVTGTLGAGTWKTEWSEQLRGLKQVTILYDNDKAGEEGAVKVAASVVGVVPNVRIARYPGGLR